MSPRDYHYSKLETILQIKTVIQEFEDQEDEEEMDLLDYIINEEIYFFTDEEQQGSNSQVVISEMEQLELLTDEEEMQAEQDEHLSDARSVESEEIRQVVETFSFEDGLDSMTFEETPTTSGHCISSGVFNVRRQLFIDYESSDESD